MSQIGEKKNCKAHVIKHLYAEYLKNKTNDSSVKRNAKGLNKHFTLKEDIQKTINTCKNI